MRDEVETKVLEVVRQSTKCDPSLITKTSKFQDLGIDSLDSVQVVVHLEAAFGFDLSNKEAHAILSVDKAIKTFSEHIAQRTNQRIKYSSLASTHSSWFI